MKIDLKLNKKINNSYTILIKKNCQQEILKFIKQNYPNSKCGIISDSKVAKLYGQKMLRELQKNNIESDIFTFPAGEKSKNLKTIEDITTQLSKAEYSRKDIVIALGGGLTGDIAGFIASIFMRGIDFIQIPTTLLAMVDASIGGKTGVNLSTGKNLVGSFKQPKAVFVDQDFLSTLSPKQIKSGLAEVIKYGVIKDLALFEFLEKNSQKILNLDEGSINKIIQKSVQIKASIVEVDEKESGERMKLNYGHTYGHAIEKNSDYKLLHGYAISIGMVLENKIAIERKLLSPSNSQRIKNLIKLYGLPFVTMKKPKLEQLKKDKKKDIDHIKIILPTKIGDCIIDKIPC